MTERRESSCGSEFSSDFYGDVEGPEQTLGDTNGCTVPAKRKGEPLEARVDKKCRVDQDANGYPPNTLSSCAGLPAEIWQSIFLYLRPEALGRLLRVNRAFNSYLKEARFGYHRPHNLGRLHVLNSESIWSSARRWVDSRMPKPLAACSEQDMWRLLKGRDCQFCGKLGCSNTGSSTKWESGPGGDGVRIIWQFAIRSCAKCLEERSEKESSLLFSTVSALLPALPYAFVSPDMHVIAAATVQESAPPPNLRIDKWFYKEHVEDIKHRLDRAKSLGQSAAEEWFKGLETAGKERLANAARWELWEAKGGLSRLLHKSTAHVATGGSSETSIHEPKVHVCRSKPGSVGETESASLQPFQPLPQRPAMPIHQSLANPSLRQGSLYQTRFERNVHDANEGKAARRADIEQRCQSFIPPIPPNVLRHMESFQAAIQISRPMTDDAWALLKPRLLAQTASAERIERDLAAYTPFLQSRLEDRHHQDTSTKEVKEMFDREYESAQKPIHAQLGAYADALIVTNWARGSSVTKENCSKFAAEVLIYVRKQFYSDLAREGEAMQASDGEAGLKSANNPASRRLHLENMKWVFDNKIKPITERYRRELFLCNGDTCEGNFKLYGFEGVIQHYGSKHTNSFGVGNSTVHWQSAEWPEEPPFHPDPEGCKAGLRLGSATRSRGQGAFSHKFYNVANQGGYSRGTSATPQMAGQGPFTFPQPSPGPYGHAQYSSHTNGPFIPPPATVGGFCGKATTYAGPLHPYVQVAQHGLPLQNSPQNSYLSLSQVYPAYSPYPPQAPVAWSPLHSGPMYQMPSNPCRSMNCSQPGTAPSVLVHDATISVHSASGQGPGPGPGPLVHPQESDLLEGQSLYHEQVRVIVALTDHFWTRISRIVSLPDSVKVHVVLQHVVSGFTARFHGEPSLDLFQHALASRPTQWTINSIREIACRLCASSISETTTAQYSRSGPVVHGRLPDLSALVSHFKSVHLTFSAPAAFDQAGPSSSSPDWTKDMIALPHESAIADLIWAPEMDDDNLAIIAEAFPDLCSRPAPRPGFVQSGLLDRHIRANNGPLSSAKGFISSNVSRVLANEECNGFSRHSQAADGPLRSPSNDWRALPHDIPVGVSPGPGTVLDDEYDPRYPTIEGRAGHFLRLHQRRRSSQLDEVQNGLCYAEPRRRLPHDSWQENHAPYSHKFPRRIDTHTYFENQAAVFQHDGSGNPSQRDLKVEEEERVSSQSSPERVELPPKATDYLHRDDGFYDPAEDGPIRRVRAGENAAEHPLHEFQPRRTACYTRILDGITRPRAGSEVQLIVDSSATERSRNPSHVPTDTMAPPDNGLNGTTGPRSIQATPALPPTGGSTIPTPADPQTYCSIYSRAVRPDVDYSHEKLHPERRFYEPLSKEPFRPVSVYQDPHTPGYRMVRTRSRYERYEAQRRRLAREKSRSPHKREHREVETRHRQDRSPPGAARPNIDRLPPQQLLPQHIPIDERGSFPSDVTPVRYRYASPPPPSYIDEYGEPVELIRVHEPYSTRDYFKDAMKGSEYVECMPHESITSGQTSYEDRSYVYHSERRNHNASAPILVPRAREVQYMEQET